MLGSFNAAKGYRDKAERFVRMAEDAPSLEIRMHYLQISDHYIALAEAEQLLASETSAGDIGPDMTNQLWPNTAEIDIEPGSKLNRR